MIQQARFRAYIQRLWNHYLGEIAAPPYWWQRGGGSVAVTIYMRQDLEKTQVPTDGWMDEEDVGYTHNGILFSNKNEGNVAICNKVGGAWGPGAEWQIREREILYNLTCMWNLKVAVKGKKLGKRATVVKG